jgi:hypothetical protein
LDGDDFSVDESIADPEIGRCQGLPGHLSTSRSFYVLSKSEVQILNVLSGSRVVGGDAFCAGTAGGEFGGSFFDIHCDSSVARKVKEYLTAAMTFVLSMYGDVNYDVLLTVLSLSERGADVFALYHFPWTLIYSNASSCVVYPSTL